MVKTLHYYLLTLMLLMLSIGARAEDKTVTIIPQTDFNLSDGISLTKDGVTVSWNSYTNGSLSRSYLKILKGKSFTVSCSAGNIIKKIVLTGWNDTRYDPDKLTVTDGNYAPTGEAHQCEWTGDAASVTFTVPSDVSRVYLTKIEVTYSTGSAPGEKQNPGLAFSSANASAVLGYSFAAPTLTHPDGLTVTYTSSNTNVATVNASTGEVAPLAAGTTTITASSAETDAYTAGEASYTLTVLELAGNGTLEHPYSVADLNKLKQINMFPESSVSVKGIINSIYSFTNYTYWNEMDYYISDDGTTANKYLVKGMGLGNARFNAKEDLMVGSKVVLTGIPYPDEFDYSELTSIEVPVSIADGEYATFYYGGFNLKVPAGVTATTYSYANNALTASKTYNEGDVIPAKTAVVLNGNANTYYFPGTTETGETPIHSNLHGSDVATTTNVEGMGKYYMLSLNAQSDPASIGFYWGADGGGAFISAAHKAYLALPASAQVKGFAFNDVTNGITAKTATAEQANAPVYSLTGVRMTGPLPAGIYVRNGKKFIVR